MPRCRPKFGEPILASTKITLLLRLIKAMPKFKVAVVLPTPPFPEAKAMNRDIKTDKSNRSI
jgi:hypothetical protein